MRKRLRCLALCAALLLLTACERPPEADDPVPPPVENTAPPLSAVERTPFALAWDQTDTLEPVRAGATNRMLAALVFEELFALDNSFSPQPVLCGTYAQAEDGLSWTFTLREGVTFSDGTQLTGVHVANSINAARSCDLYRARLAQLTAVTGGEQTVTVALSAPNGDLPALLDVPVFLSGEEDEPPLGTGPYFFDPSGEELCLRLHSGWWKGEKLPLEEILLRQTPSADTRIAAFDTGQVTLVSTDFTGTNALGYSGRYESWDYPTTAMLYLGFNTDSGACREETLRQAISRGIDRDNLTVTLLAGHADPSAMPVSPLSGLYDHTLADELGYSLMDAARLLEEGGYTRSEEGKLLYRRRQVTLAIVVNSENTFRVAVANHLAGELAKLGIDAEVNKLTWENYLTALEKGNFDVYLGQVKLTADFDLTALLTGELNYGGFRGSEAAELLARFRASAGSARKEAAHALYAQLAVDMPFTALCFIRSSILTQWGAVAGLEPTQSDPFYRLEQWKLP